MQEWHKFLKRATNDSFVHIGIHATGTLSNAQLEIVTVVSDYKSLRKDA